MVLLVVDAQNGIVDERLYEFRKFVGNIKKLIGAAREQGIEVIYVQHDDGPGTGFSIGDDEFEVYSEFQPMPDEKRFIKSVCSAFKKESGLLEYLTAKEEKDHGADKGSFLGTKLQDGDRVVMIEDVTTSGKSMEETVPKVRGAANVEIVGLMVSLNRNEKGKGEKTALTEVSELYGFPTAAIVSMPEVIEYLGDKLDPELKSRIDAYYEEYGAKE